MTDPKHSTSNPLMTVNAVTRAYVMEHETVQALQQVNLKVMPGERLCITGASGAGKSTLLNIMGGLDHPSSGTVHYQETDMYTLSSGKRAKLRSEKMGFVFQAYYLLPELTVLENVLLPAMKLPGYLKNVGTYTSQAKELIQAVGLTDRREHRPRELSGGEQQRVALARALMNEPQLILADEPTGNLDAETGGRILDLLFELSEEAGRTLVIVTHSEAVAEICSRHIHLSGGMREDD
jgi:ABC-type lipoprotein export system ATPase subunit